MKLRQLRYFAKVVEVGNMTRAAGELHVAQPALGMQIRQLEEDLGVALLVRHSRGVDPTSAGAVLHQRALAIALSAPAGTPRAIVERLNRELRRALESPDVAEKLNAAGLVAVGSSPEAMTRIVVHDVDRFAALVKAIGITPE